MPASAIWRTRTFTTITAIFLAFALITAACGGDDDDGAGGADPEGEAIESGDDATADDGGNDAADDTATDTVSDDDGSEDDATAGDDSGDGDEPAEPTGPVLTDTELDAELQAATAAIVETMFDCTTEPAEGLTATAPGVTEDTISIGFLQNDWTTLVALNVAADLGPEGEHFQLFMDTVNECGGIHGRQIETNVYVFDAINAAEQDATCVQATAEDQNLIIVGRVLTGEAPLCITEENETPLITLSQLPAEFYDRSDGRLFGVDPTGDRILELVARDLVATEVIGPDTVLGIIGADEPSDTFAIREGLLPVLDELGITYEEVIIPSVGLSCDGYNSAVSRFQEAGVTHVLGTLNALCYPPFVAEATALGWFPQYLATPFGGLTSKTSTQRMVDSGDAFDGAIGVHTLTGDAWLGEPLPPFEEECNAMTNDAFGYEYEFGDSIYGAISSLCTISMALQQGLEAAGPDLTQESLLAGMETVNDVPLRRGALGSFGPDKRTLVENVVWGQTWRIDCACWTEPNGPREVN